MNSHSTSPGQIGHKLTADVEPCKYSECRTTAGSQEQKAAPLLETPVSDTAKKISRLSMVINLINATLGCGILSLPWAMAGASILVGTGLTVLVLFLNGFTNMILVVAAERTQAFDLGSLMAKLPGCFSRPVRAFVDASVWLSVGLSLIGYFIVVADALEPSLPSLGIPAWCKRGFSVSLASLVVLPLGFMDLNCLAISSSFSVAANLYLLALVTYLFLEYGDREAAVPSCFMGAGPGTITMCSALMQAIIFQMCTLPMYEKLENRTPGRFAGCLVISFCFVFIIFIALSGMAVRLFGAQAAPNILRDLPEDFAGNAARLTMGAAVLGVFPIYLQCMVAPLRHAEERAAVFKDSQTLSDGGWISGPLQVKIMGWKVHVPAKLSELATVLIVAATAVGAWAITDLGVCNILNGAGQVSAMVGWAPGLAGIFLIGWHSRMWQIMMVSLILFANIMSGIGFAYTDNFVEALHCFQWTK